MLKLPNIRRWRIFALTAWAVLLFLAACSEPAPATEERETLTPPPVAVVKPTLTPMPVEAETPAGTAAAAPYPRQGVRATATPMRPRTPSRELRPAATATPLPTEDAAPSSSQASALVSGATWVLVSLDGQPAIDGTFATLKVDGERFGGFDGCNTFGGRHNDGTPVARVDGTFRTPGGVASTAIGCTTPERNSGPS